jgi:hypothetical protein
LVLFNFIDGREPNKGEDIEKIGTLVGRLHCVTYLKAGHILVFEAAINNTRSRHCRSGPEQI